MEIQIAATIAIVAIGGVAAMGCDDPPEQSAVFIFAVEQTLGFEGGFGDDPDDPGGPTNKGLNERYDRPELLRVGVDNIGDLTTAQAIDIYHNKYWQGVGGDMLPPRIAVAVFDHGVLSGPGTAVRSLQRIVGAVPDGKVGPKTLAAIRTFREGVILRRLLDARMDGFRAVIRKHPAKAKYLNGWINRVNKLAEILIEMGKHE